MAYCPIPIYNLHCSVGKGGINRPTDVMLVETLIEMAFRKAGDLSSGRVVDQGMALPKSLPRQTGICSTDLITWITYIQKSCVPFVPKVDGVFDPIPSDNGFILQVELRSRKRYSFYYLLTTAFKQQPREYLSLVARLKMPYLACLDDEFMSIEA